MKPADRALDIAVVGLGQAGGNLAAEFARLGYRAMALNTAHTDLSALAPGQRDSFLGAEQRIYVGIDGYDGAGADLNYGRECVHENAERIRAAVSKLADGADVVILAAGLGGGTGSAVSELVNVLQELDLPLITMTTLPNEYESGIAKVNAVRAVSDLVKVKGVGWIFADNTRLSHSFGGVSLDKYFQKVNAAIIYPLDALNRLNDRAGYHPIRTIDAEDLRALLLSTGVINYAEVTLPALSVEAVIAGVRESLQASSFMPSGFSAEEISYMGIVLEASERVLAGTPFSFFEQLNEQLKDETGGGAVYMGVYRTDKETEGGAAILRTICSTQSLPEGVQAIVNDARREGGTLRDKLQRSISTLDLGEIEEFDLFKTSTRSGSSAARRRASHPELGVPDLGGARAPRRTASSPSVAPRVSSVAPAPAAPEKEPEPVPEPAPASDTAATNPPEATAAPEAAEPSSPESGVSTSPDEDGADDAERRAEAASYSKLVATFLRTEFESTKRRVARRLDAARNSDDAHTREYADKAIQRIAEEGQMQAFESALADQSEAKASPGE